MSALMLMSVPLGQGSNQTEASTHVSAHACVTLLKQDSDNLSLYPWWVMADACVKAHVRLIAHAEATDLGPPEAPAHVGVDQVELG